MSKHEIELQETPDGELYFNLPDELMTHLGWEVGDDLKFIEKDNGYLIKKVKYETIELDFDKEELLELMNLAHEKNITFNELIAESLESFIKEFKDSE